MAPEHPLRTVLFDLDGTLIDSTRLILSSYRHTMREHRGEVPPDSAWLSGMGRPLLDQLRRFAADEDEARQMSETYMEHNRRVHDRLVRSFDGVDETLKGLRRRGFTLGIVTSKLRPSVREGMRACGISEEWFGVVITASDVEVHKPDPTPVHRALDGLGEAEPRRTLFVGDSVHDLRAGRAAGVRTGAALWGPSDREALAPGSPDHWMEEIRHIWRLLPERARPDGARSREPSGPDGGPCGERGPAR